MSARARDGFDERAVVDALLRTDFLLFVQRCFLTLNPGAQFLPNWHLDTIAYLLECICAGASNRLIINAPPRHLKSLVVSVAFPAFILGHQPRRRILVISYGSELATKFGRDFRTIVESAWYKRIFPRMKTVRALEDEVTTSLGGFRKATSVEGPLTGLGGDLFIIDDPQKPIDAQSESRRNKVNQWVANTLMSRLDNKETGVIIVVMQRVHADDLSGYLLSTSPGCWEHVSLPAIAETDEWIPISKDKDYFRKAGEPLHAARESLATLLALQREMGSYDFTAQYQQSPLPPGGNMIKRDWLRYYEPHELPERDNRCKIIQSWDCAAKEGVNNDYSVCTTWLVRDKHRWLLDVFRDRCDYPRLKATAIELAERYQPSVVLIEDTSVGSALAQEIDQILYAPVRPVSVDRDKIARLYVQQAKFEKGLVHLPKDAPFLPDTVTELLGFPNGKHDDIVDSISQALAYDDGGYNTNYTEWV